MKPAHIGVYAVILILLSGYYGYFELYRPKQAKQQEEQAQKVFSFDPLKVEEISIERGEKISLKSTKDGWQLSAPVAEKADQNTVGSFLSALSDIRNRRSMGAMDTGAIFAKTLHISVKLKGKTEEITIGSQTPTKDFRYAKSSTQSGVFLISSYEAGAVDRDLLALRDKTMIDLSPEAITQVRIKHRDFNAQLAKDSTGVWLAAGTNLRMNASRVETLIRDACWMQAKFIADNMQVGSPPDAEIELATKDSRQALTFWKIGKALFVKSSRRAQVVEIDPDFLTKIPTGLPELEDRSLVRMKASQIKKISIGAVVFTHAGDIWSQNNKPLQDGWKLDNLLEMLSALEYEKALPGPPQGLKLENSVQLFTGGAQPFMIINLYGGAMVETGGKVWLVKKDGYDMLKGSLTDLALKGVQ